MFFLFKVLSIYLLIWSIIDINCDIPKTSATNSSDDYYDYDNETDTKLFDLIEERDLIDALRETEEIHKKSMQTNVTKEQKTYNEKVKQYLETPDKNSDFVKEFEKNMTFMEANETNRFKTALGKDQVNPFILKMLDKADVYSKPLMKRLLPVVFPLTDELYNSNLSPMCLAAMIRLGKGFKEKQLWALKWADSMGRIPSGIFDGTTFDFGEFEQCLYSAMPATPTNDLVIRGKYCLGGISSKELVDRFSYTSSSSELSKKKAEERFFGHKNVKLVSRKAFADAIGKASAGSGIPERLLDFSTVMDFTYRGNGLPISVCIPDTCSALEINDFLNQTVYPKTGLPFGIAGGCQTIYDPVILDTNQIVAIVTFSSLFILVFIASFVDLFTKHKKYAKIRNTFAGKMVLCFSYQKNLNILAAPPKKIQCVDGIRVIATVWIFLAHAYLFNILMSFTWKRPKTSFLTVFDTDERYLLIRNAFLTETFFFMSSFLFTFIMFPKVEKMKGRVEYFLMITVRWMRFIPPLVASIFLLYLAPLFGTGPIFRSAYTTMNYPCYRNWYKNILFINNVWLETIDEMCNGPTWYLSAEFQLFLFAPLSLVALYRKPKLTMVFLAFLTILGCFTALMPILWDKWPTVNLLQFDDPEQLYIDLYYYLYPPYAHVSAYALGILVGYLMRKYPDQCKNLSRRTVTFIWVSSIAMAVFAFTFNKDWNKPGQSPSNFEILFFVAVKSLLISGFTCGLIFNCANGYGGFVDRFLSWRVWVPLGRLAMGVYLYQMPVIFHRAYSVKYAFEMSDHYIFTTVAFDCMFTFVLAFILFMIVEGPFGNLTTLLTTRQPNIEKTLSEKFAENMKTIETNITINGFKYNTEFRNDFNNNNFIEKL